MIQLELIVLLCMLMTRIIPVLIVLEVNLLQKKMRKFIENKNIYRMQACDSIICGYFCIEFIDSML